MPVTTAVVPVEFNIYWPINTNNPYIKSPVNYSNHTVTTSTQSGITESTAAALFNDSDIYYQTHSAGSAGLTQLTETKVFSKTFTAASGYHYKKVNGSYVNTRILNRYPKGSKFINDLKKSNQENKNTNYSNRWRFVETVGSYNTKKLATAITVEGYYTTPDHRADDVLDTNGAAITSTLEKRKTRGILLTPMLLKSATAQSSKITGLSVKAKKENDGTNDIYVIGHSQTEITVVISGTVGAKCVLHITDNTSPPKTYDFENTVGSAAFTAASTPPLSITIGNSGRKIQKIKIPKGSSDDIFSFWLSPLAGQAFNSSVPQVASEIKVYRYANIKVTIQPYTNTSGSTKFAIDAAADVVTAVPVFTNFKTNVEKEAPDATYDTIINREQQNQTLFPFSVEVEDGSSVSRVFIRPRYVANSGDAESANISSVAATNSDPANNGGSHFGIRGVKATETGGDAVTITGYVALEKIGKSQLDITFNIDQILDTA